MQVQFPTLFGTKIAIENSTKCLEQLWYKQSYIVTNYWLRLGCMCVLGYCLLTHTHIYGIEWME